VAIPETQPQQPARVTRSCRKDKKVFVFADDDSLLGLRFRPQRTIRSLTLTPVKHMHRIVAPRTQPSSESCRQLVVHKEFHAAVARTR
jgi:hypothetical protein